MIILCIDAQHIGDVAIWGEPKNMAKLLSGFGLFFDSEVDIPGAIKLPTVPHNIAPIIVHIERSAREVGEPPPIYRLDDQAIIFSPPDLGRFRIQSNRIAIGLFPDADHQFACDLLIATAIPALLWLRGDYMLHAAGVILPGETKVTAIAGRSGSGKSTVAHQLIAQGAELIGDDSLRLEIGDDSIIASGLPGGLFIGREGERSFHAICRGVVNVSAALGRIIMLSEYADQESMAWLSGIDAVQSLLANRHRPATSTLLGHGARTLKQATHVARSVPILTWSRCEGELAIDPTHFRDMVSAAEIGEVA